MKSFNSTPQNYKLMRFYSKLKNLQTLINTISNKHFYLYINVIKLYIKTSFKVIPGLFSSGGDDGDLRTGVQRIHRVHNILRDSAHQ